MIHAHSLPDRPALVAFGGATVIGGMNFVAVRFSNRELPPMFGAGARFAVAALVLFVFMRLRGKVFPQGRELVGALLYGVFAFGVFYALLYWALQSVSAGIASVLMASTPLLTLFVVAFHRIEPFRVRGLVGSAVAIAGIAVMANTPSAAALPLLPTLAVLGGALVAGYSGVILKMFPPSDPVATNATGMGVGAVLLLAASALAGESWVVPELAATWMALLYLVGIGSLALFGLFLFVLERWTASAVAYMAALMPIVSTIGGAIVAGEAITLAGVLGGAIVLFGVWIGALSRPRVRRGASPPP